MTRIARTIADNMLALFLVANTLLLGALVAVLTGHVAMASIDAVLAAAVVTATAFCHRHVVGAERRL